MLNTARTTCIVGLVDLYQTEQYQDSVTGTPIPLDTHPPEHSSPWNTHPLEHSSPWNSHPPGTLIPPGTPIPPMEHSSPSPII